MIIRYETSLKIKEKERHKEQEEKLKLKKDYEQLKQKMRDSAEEYNKVLSDLDY